jgi:CubicO group peptidase (beta-lactamase class C family)
VISSRLHRLGKFSTLKRILSCLYLETHMNLEAFSLTFKENFLTGGELGASAAICRQGHPPLSLGAGFQDTERSEIWQSDTAVLVWSATKGPAAACLLHALDAAQLSLETPVAQIWPEFATAGKAAVTLRMVLEHRAGLCALDTPPPVEDREAVAAALAKQTPAWEPGTAHGYHPRTFGFLLDELLRRLGSGESLGAYWQRVFAGPLALDFWIGLPTHLLPRVAPVFSARTLLPKGDPFLQAFLTPGSLTSRSFASPRGLHSAASMNTPEARTACYPGFGGIGTAPALAKFYAMLACGGVWEGRRFFEASTLESIRAGGVQGPDRVLQMETSFSCGFMRDPVSADGTKKRHTFGPSPFAFGHPGAGGSLAFADPENGLGFAYVMNQMEPGVLPNHRATALVEALYTTA